MNIKKGSLTLSVFLLMYVIGNTKIVHSEVKDNQFIQQENEFNNGENNIYIENNIMEEKLTTNNNLGFIEKDKNVYYILEDGSYAIGLHNIDNEFYYFNEEGIMQKGWISSNNKWYYAEAAGKLKKGWLSYNGNWYYLYDNREMATGFVTVNDKKYYLNNSGAMATGWIKVNNQWYYAESSGELKNGWLLYKDKWYYIDEEGKMATGFINVNNKKYYLNNDGIMLTGWVKVDNKWYYAESSGAIKIGWLKDNNKWYYLYDNGEMATGFIYVKDKRYYLNYNGEMLTDWIKIDNKWYYANRDGDLAIGFIKDGNEKYYLGQDYVMIVGEQYIEDKGYYFHANGQMARFEFVNEKYYGKDGIFKDLENGDKLTIVLDPGHNYGGDDGAYATHNGIRYIERDLNMQVALKLKSCLEAEGYNVLMTRDVGDRFNDAVKDSLKKRVELANSKDTDLFISIHHDSSSSSTASGFTAFYSTVKGNSLRYDKKLSDISKKIATNIVNKVSSDLGYKNRGARDNDFYVIKNTLTPAILLECGFISNATEAKKIANNDNQLKLAEKITSQINVLFNK